MRISISILSLTYLVTSTLAASASASSVYLDSVIQDPISVESSSSNPLQIELPFIPADYQHLSHLTASSTFTVKDIVASQNGKHVHLSHQEFPDVKMRLKRIAPKMQSRADDEMDPEAFCDTTVTSWSGCEYIHNDRERER